MKKKKLTLYLLTSVIILILIGTTTTFAWFFINKQVEVDYGSEITCQAGTSLEVSMLEGIDPETNEETWSPYGGYVKYSTVSAKIEDISGNGKELYVPTSLVTDPDTGELMPEGLKDAEKTDADGYGQFLEMHVKLRSQSAMNVYLSGDSVVTPLTTSDTDRNAYGNFSKHYIVGAIRIAILSVDENDNETLKMIWAPRPTVELSYNKNTGKYSLVTDGAIEDYSYYMKNSQTGLIEKYYVTPDEFAEKSFVLGSTNTNESYANNSPVLTEIAPELGVNLDEEKLIIRVWFEGTDREANQALGGGQVKVNLKFIGMNKKLDPTDEIKERVKKITAVSTNKYYTFDNVDEDILYSLNGYTWKPYTETEDTEINKYLLQQQKDTKIYFKVTETELYYEYYSFILLKYEGEVQNES